MIELAILALLKESDMHGYELRRRIRKDFGTLISASFGSLYPALSRLLSEGAVMEVSPKEIAVPSTGSLTGERAVFRSRSISRIPTTRSRRIYKITPYGDTLLQELLTSTEVQLEDAKGFVVRFAFGNYLDSEHFLKLCTRRLDLLKQRLEDLDKLQPPSQGANVFRRSLLERSKRLIMAEIDWLESFMPEYTKSQLEAAKK